MAFEIDLEHRVGACAIKLNLRTTTRSAALVGPSGIGKSTVLNCVAGLVRPARGRVVVEGNVLFDSESAIDVRPDRRGAGYVFQDLRLFPHLSVAGNLAYGERLAGTRQRLVGRGEVVELMGIGHLLARSPVALSGGEQRRVAIGRALLSAPRFLLLDEPFASLDAERAETLRTLVGRIGRDFALPMLLVSHDRDEVALLAEDVVTLG